MQQQLKYYKGLKSHIHLLGLGLIKDLCSKEKSFKLKISKTPDCSHPNVSEADDTKLF